jgi:hypothetical protein
LASFLPSQPTAGTRKPAPGFFRPLPLLACFFLQIWLLVFIESKEEKELGLQLEGRLMFQKQNQELTRRLADEMMKALDERRFQDFNRLKKIRTDNLG